MLALCGSAVDILIFAAAVVREFWSAVAARSRMLPPMPLQPPMLLVPQPLYRWIFDLLFWLVGKLLMVTLRSCVSRRFKRHTLLVV